MADSRTPAHARAQGPARSRRIASTRPAAGQGRGGSGRPPGRGSAGSVGGGRGGGRGRKRRTKAEIYRRRRIIAGILSVFLILFIWVSISLVGALTNPSFGSSYSARFAEWGRDHGMGFAVTWMEQQWYAHHQPPKGGKPAKGAFNVGAKTQRGAVASSCPDALAVPPRVISPAQPQTANEGVWQPAGRLVANCYAIYETYVRPDNVHTSFVVGIAWMDPKLLSATLYSGSYVPGGGPYRYTAPIQSPTPANSLVSAFNAGFRMQDANGGYYTDGKVIVPLRVGAASAVIYKDGSMKIGAWGSDVTMTPEVVSVRQNLDLIVAHGAPVPGLDVNDNSRWGATLGGGTYVWRSGVGETANGALVYVGGPGMTITALADLLTRAGAVRAMELDINPDWVNFSSYAPSIGQPASGSNGSLLLSGMTGGPERYFQSWWSRDFFTMSARYPANGSTTASTTTSTTRSHS